MPENWFSLRRAFDFSGRASRREFFLFQLIGYAILFAPVLLIGSLDARPSAPGETVQGLLLYVYRAFLFAIMALNIAVFVALSDSANIHLRRPDSPVHRQR